MKKKISKVLMAFFMVCAFASMSYADGWYPQTKVVKEVTDSCAAFLASLASFHRSVADEPGVAGVVFVKPVVAGPGAIEPGVVGSVGGVGLVFVEPGNKDCNPGDKPPMNPVPEPATMLLFGAGIAGLAGAKLRRKNK